MKKIFILLIIALFLVLFAYNNAINNPISKSEEIVQFKIEKGQSVDSVATNLVEAGLIKSKTFFKLYIKNNGFQSELQAGDYELSESMPLKEMVEIFIKGNAIIKELTIKIIEGWKISEMDDYLSERSIIQKGSMVKLSSDPNNYDYDFLEYIPKGQTLEGYMFPDTYRIFENATIEDISKKMLDNLDSKLTDKVRNDIKKQGKTIHEIITMASIIEKEVRSFDDMKIVSGIFWNRINHSTPLESCASLAYILGVNKKQYTYDDTEIDSPYNTYKNQGLPPGPICNPGLNAIMAAVYPTESDYFYFLSSFEDGETIYSKTYEEHLRNKAKYLK